MQWYLPTLPNFYSSYCMAISKRKITIAMICAAVLGFIGVFCVAKPDQGLLNWISVIGIASIYLLLQWLL